MERIRALLEEIGLVLGAVLRPAAKSVRENSGLAALSVVLAFGLWIFVTDAENPEQTRVLPIDLVVRPVNVPADIAVAAVRTNAGRDTVRVEVRVEENVFDSLTKDDFRATVDLDGLTVGEYDRLVEVTPLTTRGNLRIVDVLPKEITVTLAQLLSKTVPVDLETNGALPSDFSLGKADVETETAIVAGAQTNVEKVVKVVAALDIEGRTESFESAVHLEPRDQQGALVEDVVVDPAIIDVSIEIAQKSFSRSLAVSPKLNGTPRQGYNVVGVTVDPPVITVFASQAFINQAVSILTQPVDIEDASENVIRTVSLDLPTGASVRGGVNVTVTVNISPAPGQLMFAVPVSAQGVGDNLTIVGSLPSVQVFLFGPLPALLELNPNDLSARVDLGGNDAGTHKVKVEVTAPSGLEVRSISPAEVEIHLEQR
ncbi:MAG TPA: CdaR family protein [Dehalococcoidia bacterium]|nr:CdaR family protein [Dehalococcoidia bacterium]